MEDTRRITEAQNEDEDNNMVFETTMSHEKEDEFKGYQNGGFESRSIRNDSEAEMNEQAVTTCCFGLFHQETRITKKEGKP